MVLTETIYISAVDSTRKSYVSLAGTAGEVLQALADNGVNKDQIVEMKNDATFCVYSRR